MRDDTTTSDSGLDQGIELLITSDSKEQVSGSNSLNLKILRGVSCQLKDLGGEVLKNSSRVDGGSSTDSTVGAHSALQESVDSTNWELNTKLVFL